VDNHCLQYFTGVSGTVRSFNYDGVHGRQLSNQVAPIDAAVRGPNGGTHLIF